MKINSKSLSNLCSLHSVVGDTLSAIKQIKQLLDKSHVESKITDYGLLVFGNLQNPKTLVSAHIDEVGFHIVRKNDDNTFLINNAGLIEPVMLNNSTVYVQTAKGKVAGMIYPKKELGDNKPDHFSEIFLDVIDHQKINIGDFGSYQREFYENGNKIIATGLDNKISVELILELILEYPQLLKTTMFALVTEEETTYDCIAGIADMYKPQYGIVLDMLPVNQISNHKVEILPEIGKGPSILMSMHKYFLHPIIREKLFKLTTPYQKVVVDINFPPEPQLLQRNGVTKGINVLLPMLGWHNRTYSMNKNDYAQMKKLVVELIKIFK